MYQQNLKACTFAIIILVHVLLLFSVAHGVPIGTAENNGSSVFDSLTMGWYSVAITVFISFPWLVISVYDAIDSNYRPVPQVAFRLSLATSFLFSAYTLGLIYVIALAMHKPETDVKFDEIATILVLLIFNLWHVGRNIRGWSQFIAIMKIKPVFQSIQRQILENFPSNAEEEDKTNAFIKIDSPSSTVNLPLRHLDIQGLLKLHISNRLVDNDLQGPTSFLNPFFKLKPAVNTLFPTLEEEAWAVAIWRAWWTQDTTSDGMEEPDLTAPPQFKCDKAHRFNYVHDLLSTDPSGLIPGRIVTDMETKSVIKSKLIWAKCLLTYGGEEGQQDTHGEALPAIANVLNSSGIALLVKEKTCHVPHRMCGLWYNTARFEEVYDEKAFDGTVRQQCPQIMFPKWTGWLRIAREIAEDGASLISTQDRTLTLLAGELASTSLILIRYGKKYRELVDQIHKDGLNARWTFGWSGLLACFTHLWTKERIFIAMLNGLSLLALTLTTNVADIDPNVRAMLYGYASFTVSDRAVGRRIAQARRDELDRRYSKNKGKTCRGSGLHATRLACRALNLPAEASHMDGLPSFSTGWAGEFLERKPGNQEPEHGEDHAIVEARQGSSNAWRYPYSHS